MNKKLYIVIPCYNEEAVLPETAKRVTEKLNDLIAAGKIDGESRIVFVDDGSTDRTWEMIARLHEWDKHYTGVKLSRNRGHQNALLAGLMTVREDADLTVSMDADLQDDVNAIDLMVDKYLDGCDIVYGVRSQRAKDGAFKRSSAQSFYKLIDKLGGEVVYNHADYRLMSRRALDALAEYKEVNLFLRGIVPMLGFRTDVVYYERAARFAGESKYPLKKMLALAFNGISSLSSKPLNMITGLGGLTFLGGVLLLLFSVVRAIQGYSMLNWKISAILLLLCTGLLLISLGVVGGYVGKIYLESKQRPRYFVEEYLHRQD